MERQFSSFLSKYGKIGAIIELCRPWNAIVMLLLVIIAAKLVSTTFLFKSIFAGLCFFIMYMAATIINDVYDYKIDKINMPYRPIERGSISKKEALFLSSFFYILSIVIAFYFGFLFLSISLVMLLMSLLYSIPQTYLVGKPIIGNIILSLLSVFLPLIGGAILVIKTIEIPTNLFLFALSFTILFIFISFLKDLKDVIGDKHFGKRTLASLIGERKTIFISLVGIVIFFPINIYYFNLFIKNIIFLFISIIIYFLFLTIIINSIKNRIQDGEKIFSRARVIILCYIIFILIFSLL